MQVFRTNAVLRTAAVAVIFKNSSYLKNSLHFVLQPFVLLYKNLLGFVCWIHPVLLLLYYTKRHIICLYSSCVDVIYSKALHSYYYYDHVVK